ncbi:MAG: HEPN domain-containing protein [Nanoarchaeota archaeon]|nr:HEPN domain-containing protein [Nanoarchaeota archaeon]
MIDKKRIEESKSNFSIYLKDGLLKKEFNDISMNAYAKNSDLSLKLADKLINDKDLRPYLWVVVTSYYSMFYIANAVILKLGYKTSYKIVHKVTSDALIVLVLDKLKKELLEEYEQIRDDALEIASARAEEIIKNYENELDKRSRFQYNMSEEAKENKARTSLNRAKEFVFEMKKILENKNEQ